MERYNIYYKKYSILANDYIDYIKIVYTDDIYHEIGLLICSSMEHINEIRYTKPSASIEECEKLWVESGYKKLSETLWVNDTPCIF